MLKVRWALVVALLLPATAFAVGTGDRAIRVGLSSGDASLACSIVAAGLQVHFDARHAGFRPARIQLMVNGERAPAASVHGAWPRLTLDGGLSPGRNTVTLRTTTSSGTEIDRSIVVKVGDSVHSADGVRVACQSPLVNAAIPAATEPVSTVTETVPTVVEPQPIYAPPAYETYPTTIYYESYPATSYYGGYYGYPYGWGWNAGYVWPAITLGLVSYGIWGGWHHHWYHHRHWRRASAWHGHWHHGGGHHWHGGGHHWHH